VSFEQVTGNEHYDRGKIILIKSGLPFLLLFFQHMTLDVYIALTWDEPRLPLNWSCITSEDFVYSLSVKSSDILWQPDVDIAHLLTLERSVSFKKSEVVYIEPYNTVAMVGTYKLTINCDMKFEWYPFDSQICHLDFFTTNCTDADIHDLIQC
jgi:hypothetical protein